MIRLEDVLDRQLEKVERLNDTDLIRVKRGDSAVLISVEDFVWCILGLLKEVNRASGD